MSCFGSRSPSTYTASAVTLATGVPLAGHPRPTNNNADEAKARARVATETLGAISNGTYTTTDGVNHDISANNNILRDDTQYFSPDDPLLVNWRGAKDALKLDDMPLQANTPTDIQFRLQSTLSAAREWAWSARAPYERVGVLNCGSALYPGGGFKQGRQTQECALARASNLHHSLTAPVAQPFYAAHKVNRNGGFYSNAMIYSKDVTLVKDDFGEWAYPLTVDVVTSAPVDRHAVLQSGLSGEKTVDQPVNDAMVDRMGRILRLFEEKGDTVLILTGFGTGLAENDMATVAGIWAQLVGPGGRFQGKFTTIVFAILGDLPYKDFCKAFQEELHRRAEHF
ncbi:hypothetical protein FRB99_007417 [Tulasnella sp. 403]|nr:hypothetical protein FRB99_007417 [Tulasnella sp. 403]